MATVNDTTRHTCVNNQLRDQLKAAVPKKRWVVTYRPKPKPKRQVKYYDSIGDLLNDKQQQAITDELAKEFS